MVVARLHTRAANHIAAGEATGSLELRDEHESSRARHVRRQTSMINESTRADELTAAMVAWLRTAKVIGEFIGDDFDAEGCVWWRWSSRSRAGSSLCGGAGHRVGGPEGALSVGTR